MVLFKFLIFLLWVFNLLLWFIKNIEGRLVILYNEMYEE